MNQKDAFPKGGGRPFNGGFNTGGGIVKLSSHALTKSPNFQSTLQHELGHSFGLLHVDAYGYDMKRNNSIMAYNKLHHTKKFKPSKHSGQLIPEDIRGLALNSHVFKNLEFTKTKHIPNGYQLATLKNLKPMEIPNHPNEIKLTTTAGETNGSSVQNIVQNRIRPSIECGKITYDKKSMWHSGTLKTGWAEVTIAFDAPVSLDRVAIYSQHSGRKHAVVAAKLFTLDSARTATRCAQITMSGQDGELNFDLTRSKVWRLELKAGKSKKVVIRGIRFFSNDCELYPPLIPLAAEQ